MKLKTRDFCLGWDVVVWWGKARAIGVLKAFEMPDRKDQVIIIIWVGQESILSLSPWTGDHPKGIFPLGCMAAGWVREGMVGAMPLLTAVILEDTTVKSA